MKHTLRNIARAGSILVALALLWGVAGGLLPVGPHPVPQVHAAVLSIQPVAMAPVKGAELASKGSKGSTTEAPALAAGTGFTYQGRLVDNNNPANGQYDFVFTLFDALTGGNQVSTPVNITNQTVSAGLFTVSLDYGSNAFSGDARWLQIGVRSSGGGSFTTLAPRQLLGATPFALSTRWEGDSNKPFPYNPLRQPNSISAAYPAANAGDFTSMAIGADGMGLISQEDVDARDLVVTHCENTACTSANTYIIDSSIYIGNFTSLSIGSDGLGLISYYDYGHQDLKVAHCSNVVCSSATSYTIDSAGDVGNNSSLTIGADGLGFIAYQDNTNHTLKVAHCTDLVCNSATTAVVDPAGSATFDSVTLGVDGLPLIAYTGSTVSLKVAHCSNPACSSSTLTTLGAPYYGQWMSITTGSDGLGLISYVGSGDGFQRLKVAHCSNILCSNYTISIIDSSSTINYQTSIAIGPDGLGLISYQDYTNSDLKVAHCADVICTTATATTVDSQDYVGDQSSIAFGVDGLALISYRDSTTGNMKVLHCGSPLCLAYQHRR
jgi:hypothetical protein